MYARALLALLVISAGARAERSWIFEAEQSLLTVEVGGVSAVSRALTGRLRELEDGAVRMEVRLPLTSLKADRPVRHDARQFPEVVFEGEAPRPGKNGALRLAGTLRFHGVSQAIELPLTLVRVGGMTYGHGTLSIHLRDFGFALPEGAPDEARIDIDAGLRPETALASSG